MVSSSGLFRYAVWFTPLTLAVCVVAYLASSDPVRVLAVLVVATPCPLILATPVAIIGGLNRAARQQIVIRNGGALEQLGGVTVAMFDKTGTLTVGRPALARVVAVPPFTEASLLALASAVEHGSDISSPVRWSTAPARAPSACRPRPTCAKHQGKGWKGGSRDGVVVVGAREYVRRRAPDAAEALDEADGDRAALRAYVAVDRRPAGFLEFADAIRPEAGPLLRRLGALGITRMALLSGDRRENVEALGAKLGFTETHGLLPQDKVALIEAAMADGARVVMVGDGTNDAPALSTATVGIALASHGGGITAEAADIVILSDDLSRVADPVETSRWTVHIARQSIFAGFGISGVAMIVAAAGYISPITGAAAGSHRHRRHSESRSGPQHRVRRFHPRAVA